MKERFLISIIIPIYNVEQYLRQCLDSVINQTYKNLEIILVDDGSTDNSGKICDEYAVKDNRIKVIHKENGGVSSARNAGIDIAKGEYIGFVDSDDYIEKDMYEYLLYLCLKYKTKVSVCEYFSNNQINLYSHEQYIPIETWYSHPLVTAYVVVKLFSKDSIKNIRFKTDIFVGEDGLFSLEILSNLQGIAYGDGKKYYYRYNTDGVTNNSFNTKLLSSIKSITLMMDIAKANKWHITQNKLLHDKIFSAIWLLHKIIISNFDNKFEIKKLCSIIRQNLYYLLISNASFLKKLFAISCCLNFSLTKKLYKLQKIYKR